ncbi:unnamed protein product [Adineta steineri]|uniref:Uncharacterized protein n=1 Tax=Adineta steineri TaxID=433720 RepID=A0A818P6C4_9BILA|nr:unnamed protein product [Adineta steineri]CAF3616172.1 unnamed protein product [Adineta steineri]CAF3880547.1 unnamed protein product [Adineta steineri]
MDVDKNVNIQKITTTFEKLRKLIDNQENNLKKQVRAIEQKKKPAVDEHLESIEKFAASNTYTRPACNGRACANCGKCRDWYYTGDQEIWEWIKNVKNWNENERKRWDDGKYSKCFTKREGSTCRGRFDYYYDRDHVYHGGHIDFGYTYSCRDCGAPALYRDGDCCGSGTDTSFIREVYSYCQCLNNIKKK